ISLVCLSSGYILLFFFADKLMVFVGSLLMMCGFLSGMAVFGAKVRDLTPVGQAGRFQGVRIFSQVLIPGIVGPYIGKLVLKNAKVIENSDGTTSFVPNRNIFLASLVVAIITIIVTLLVMTLTKKPRINKSLKTPFEDDAGSFADEYPRPQMKRDSYFSLCGEWELYIKNKNGEGNIGKIAVPYPPESRLSGIERELKRGERYIYRKSFSLPDGFNIGRVIINFGAVDQYAFVKVNGKEVGSHTGGYLPFSFDITDFIREGENEIEVEIEDALDKDLPYGKQCKKRGGMWYTPISGIWQAVWLESVPEHYIEKIKITPTLNSVKIETVGGEKGKTVKIVYEDGREESFSYEGDSIELHPEIIRLWTPDDPYLYSFTLTDGTDRIESYFALRTVGIEKVNNGCHICLNGKPCFFHGLLDQGYYSDGIYLPATPRGFLFDILEMKWCGFNMLRKHIKIEPELFYYYCDKYGMLVFQDMVNSGNYSFLIDTALPTVGLKRGITHRASKKRREVFEAHSKETVELLYNHPSVVYYTIFNEGWGQYGADRLYTDLKACDETRVWDTTSGWFK
ncbi:MAG: hypothetical protein IIW20_05175, partial [Clostridia bacterium]|nr:hypothetical protein [Clostridia bacterium]